MPATHHTYKSTGLRLSKKDPLKGNVPKDLDGAFRIHNRLDGKTEAQLRGAK